MADAFSGPLDGFALWLATEGRPRSQATIRNYCLYLRQLRSYALQRGLTSWEQITRAQIRAFLAQRRQEASSASATVAYFALKSFFRYLESEELEGTGYHSPLVGLAGPGKLQPPVVPVLSKQQLGWLIQAASAAGPLEEALVRLLTDTGIRIGEAAATADRRPTPRSNTPRPGSGVRTASWHGSANVTPASPQPPRPTSTSSSGCTRTSQAPCNRSCAGRHRPAIAAGSAAAGNAATSPNPSSQPTSAGSCSGACSTTTASTRPTASWERSS